MNHSELKRIEPAHPVVQSSALTSALKRIYELDALYLNLSLKNREEPVW